MENSCLKQHSAENSTMQKTLLASEEGNNFQQIGVNLSDFGAEVVFRSVLIWESCYSSVVEC